MIDNKWTDIYANKIKNYEFIFVIIIIGEVVCTDGGTV